MLVLLLAIAGLTTSSAQNRGAAASADIPRLQFEKYTLPNGLEVILSQKRGLPMVAVNLWYHVGPANEEPGRTGFAHLFEHMMFQSSKHVPPDSHFRCSRPPARATSTARRTTTARTTSRPCPSNQLELALWLESDRMGYLLDKVDQAALRTSRTWSATSGGRASRTSRTASPKKPLIQTLFPQGHPYYGNVIGSHEDIQAAKLDDVKRFFRQYYAPNNASLAIVGDFEPAQTKALVEKYFGTLKRGPAVPPIKAETPKITAERRKVVTGSRRVAARLHGVAHARRSSSLATRMPTSPRRSLAAADRAACTRSWSTSSRSRRT